MKKIIFLVVITGFFAFNLQAQDKNSPATANKYIYAGNFNAALPIYKALVKKNPKNVKYNYLLAVCYLNTNIDKTQAIPYLKKVIEMPGHSENALYLLGRAYQYAYKFDDAIATFRKFKAANKGTKYNLDDATKQIEYCNNAKQLIKYPLKITYKDLGTNINSQYPEYYPFVPKNESFIMFNSRRDDGSTKKYDGSYHSEIYISKSVDGEFQPARILNQVNTPDGDEQVIGMSADGKKVLFYLNNKADAGNIYIANFDGVSVKNLHKLSDAVNSKNDEIAASITNKGDAVYFASDRPGGYGGVDIYVVRKLPDGKWSLPKNLGATINTAEDEDFPNISGDGKVLYFSSKGHTSMGGYDIFRAEWSSKKHIFDETHNIGYPINTPEDNTNLRINESGRYAYISAHRKDSKGDLDIYRMTFTNVKPRYTVIKGYVSGPDSTFDVSSVSITVNDNKTGNLFGSYLPNSRTGRYIIILPAGKYTLMVDDAGYKSITQSLDILGKSSFEPVIKKDIKLKKK